MLDALEDNASSLFGPEAAEQMLNAWGTDYAIKVYEGEYGTVRWRGDSSKGVSAADLSITIVQMIGMIPLTNSVFEDMRGHSADIVKRNVALARQYLKVKQ